MTVTELKMAPGTFSVDLEVDLPPSITQQLTTARTHPQSLGFATLVVTREHLDPVAVGDDGGTVHPLQRNALYAGVVERITSRKRRIEGYGLAGWLRSPGGHSDLYDGTNASDPMPQWGARGIACWAAIERMIEGNTIAAWPMRACDGLWLGNVPANKLTSTTMSIPPGVKDRVEVIDQALRATGWVWRVRPAGLFDYGTPAEVWGTPRVVVAPGLGDDPRWVTINGHASSWDESVEDWVNFVSASRGSAYNAATVITYSTRPGAVGYIGPRGVPIQRGLRGEIASGEANADWQIRMATALAELFDEQQQITVGGDIRDGGSPIGAGESVWAYDPSVGLVDTANEISVAGQIVHPVAVPIDGVTWSITGRMGTYIVYWDRAGAPVRKVLDLTPHVVADTSPTTIDVGSLPTSF